MTDNNEHIDTSGHELLPEGEEIPPPHTRTMGIIRWTILIVISIFALVMILNYFGVFSGSSDDQQTITYYCPMHPTYTSDKPGECPICGMNLVPDSSSTQSMPGMEDEQREDTTTSMQGMDDMGRAPVSGLVPITIEPRRLQLLGIRTAKVELRTISGKVNIVGIVTPDESRLYSINLRTQGWIEKTFVDKTGQMVTKGQPLLSIYSPELFQAVQDYSLVMKSRKRLSAEGADTAVAETLVDAAGKRLLLLGLSKSDIEIFDSADTMPSVLTLHSPIDGYVLEKSAISGAYTGIEQSLYNIADLSEVWILGDVYEQDLLYVKPGQSVRVTVTAYPEKVFFGTVDYVYPTIKETTRTTSIRVRLKNPELLLKPGMYANVIVERSSPKTLVVPTDAIIDGGDVKYAFVVIGGNHFEPRSVTVGSSSNDWIEVEKGLDEGDTVVTSANFLIDSESRLKAAISGMSGMPGM